MNMANFCISLVLSIFKKTVSAKICKIKHVMLVVGPVSVFK